MLTTRVLLLGLLSAGCGSAPPPEETSTAPARELEQIPDVDQEVVRSDYGDVVVHTLVSRADRAGTATHVVESATGLVVVDTHLLRRDGQALRAFVDALNKPVERVIISHGHPDHYFGLEYFEDLPVYALPQTIADIERRFRGHRSGHVDRVGDAITDRARPPEHEQTVGEETIVGVRFHFEQATNGEDVEQLVIRLPDQGLVMVQDLSANGYHPFVGTLRIEGWRTILNTILADAPYTRILVGHGPPGGPELLRATLDYLDVAEEVIESGPASQEAFVETMKARFPDLEGDLVLPISARFVVSH